jgi:hypothetical protein
MADPSAGGGGDNEVGLGHIVALYHHSCILYHIQSHIRHLYFEATMRPNPRTRPGTMMSLARRRRYTLAGIAGFIACAVTMLASSHLTYPQSWCQSQVEPARDQKSTGATITGRAGREIGVLKHG